MKRFRTPMWAVPLSILFVCLFVSCEPWNLERLDLGGKGELKFIEPQATINYHVSDTMLTTEVLDTISIKNTGNGDLNIHFIESKHPAVYSVVWNGKDLSIPAGTVKDIVIRFKPNVYAVAYQGYLVFSSNGKSLKDTLMVQAKAFCTWQRGDSGGGGGGFGTSSVESVPYDVWYGCSAGISVERFKGIRCGSYYGKLKARIKSFNRSQGTLTLQWENCSSLVPLTNTQLIVTKQEGSDIETKLVSNFDIVNKFVTLNFSFTPLFERGFLTLIFIDENDGVSMSYIATIDDIWF